METPAAIQMIRVNTTWWKSVAKNVAFLLVAFWAIHYWQSRTLLSSDGHIAAPAFSLNAMDGKTYSLKDFQGKPTIIYFFAPWCSVCHLSISNLETLKKYYPWNTPNVLIVALAFDDIQEIREFIQKLSLESPVLIGSQDIAEKYKISAFPTYYLLDEKGLIKTGTVGYSAAIGLWWRLFFLRFL